MKIEELDPALLNASMNLGLQFGLQWRQRIGPQILETCPELSEQESEDLSSFITDARDWAHALIACSIRSGTPSETDARDQIRQRFPWIDKGTLERLWNQGCYFAMKQ